MVDFTATPGDTVLGKIRETYGRLPQVEINRLLEEFERINQRPAGNILANEVYVLPKSTYYRDQVGESFGADELLDSISTAAAYRNKALGRVNAWRGLAGVGPATFTPSTLASSLRSYSTATDKDIQDRIIAQALGTGFTRIEQLEPWFTRRGYDKVFLKDTAAALRARLNEKRSAEDQRIQLRDDAETRQYKEGDQFRQVALADALQSIKIQPGNIGYVAGLDTDPAAALRTLQSRLLALQTKPGDVTKIVSAFNSQQKLEALNRADKIDDGLTKISNDLISRMATQGLTSTKALEEFGTRAKDYPVKEKNAARSELNNFISKMGEEKTEERAKKEDVYKTEKRALDLGKLRRDERTAQQTDAQNEYALDLLMPIAGAVLDGSMGYEDAADAFMEQMRSNQRGKDLGVRTTDRAALQGYVSLLQSMIDIKKPDKPTEVTPLASVRTQNLWAELATRGTEKDDNVYISNLAELNTLIRKDIKAFLSKIPGAGQITLESMGQQIADRLIPTLQRIPEGERKKAFLSYLSNFIRGDERTGFINRMGDMGGSNALTTKVVLKAFKDKKEYESWLKNLKQKGFNKDDVIAIGQAEGRIDDAGDALIAN